MNPVSASGRPASRFIVSILLCALAALLLAVACRPKERRRSEDARNASPRDIILITIDTLRADALGFTGNARVKTPNIDRLAREGLVFSNAHAHNVMTLPSHVNILTGLYPYQHGVRDNEGFRLDPKIPTLATLLKARGYATAAAIGAYPLDARFGLSRGFDLYDEKYPQGANEYDFSEPERPAAQVVAVARSWYQTTGSGPRFLWVHLYDCHAPHIPPPALAAEYADRPYLGEVAGVDLAIGPLLDDIRASGRPTMILLTSDHGEALGDHGELTHGIFAYEATLHIPMILWAPGLATPGVRHDLVRHVDVLPTLLEAASAAAPAGLPGQSLLHAKRAPGDTSYFEALMATLGRGWAPLRGEMTAQWKYIDLPIPELYDLAADPQEQHDRFAQQPEIVRTLARALPAQKIPQPGEETSEAVARLRSLGYLGGRAPAKESYGPSDDPKNLIDIDRDIQTTIALYQHGRLAEAIALARTLVARRPSMGQGYEYLSYLQGQSGHDDQAIATLEAARRRGLLDERLLSRLALLYNAHGRSRDGLALLEPLGDRAGTDTWNARGIILASLGRIPEALEAFHGALRADPKNASAYQNIGLTYVQHGKPQEAVAAFQKAFAINDRLPRAWNGLGVAQEQLGRHQEAMQCWQKAVALDPEQFEALLNLGTVALQQGQSALGRQALERFVATAPPGLFGDDIRRARALLATSSAKR